MIPLSINDKSLYEIFDPESYMSSWTDEELLLESLSKCMLPSEVRLTSETYSRDAERTADYELEELTFVNRKAKPEFTWGLIRADYVERLFNFLGYTYDFKNADGVVIPVKAADLSITYRDFTGLRTINAYLGQTIEGTLIEEGGVLYWENFRIAFPER